MFIVFSLSRVELHCSSRVKLLTGSVKGVLTRSLVLDLSPVHTSHSDWLTAGHVTWFYL